MTVLLFIGIFAVIGCVLYLPFFLWFRYRRPRQGPYAVKLNYTPAGWALVVAEVAALFVGFALIGPASGVLPGVFAPGGLGLLQWLICVVIAVHVIGMLLRGANIPLQRPAPAPGDAAPTSQVAAAVPPSPGYRVATIRGVPVFAHRSYLFGGVFIGVAVGPHLAGIVGCCIAYAALFAIHEFAHAATGRLLGLRVQAIELSGIGGLCRMSVPRRMRDAWLVYSAGLASQLLLLLATLAVIAIDGEPQAPFGKAVVITFTWVNAMLFVVNLIPGRTHDGHRTDGGVLWGLAQHRWRGAPHPLAAQMAASPVFPPGTSLMAIEPLVPEGFHTGIEMFNDDTTPMEFVVEMLERHVGLDREHAMAAMLRIHQHGGALLPLPSREAAQAAADAIARDARAQGHRLTCGAVSLD